MRPHFSPSLPPSPRSRFLLTLLAALTFVASAATSTTRAESSTPNPLKIQLVANTTHIQIGKPFEVGLQLSHPSGYHTYWKQPGIVGVPTKIEWDLPKGWKAGDIQWPAPKRIFMFQIRAQGFQDEVLLPIQLTPPAGLTSGTTVTLKGKASWMCCGRECNPGTTDLSLTLPVSIETARPDKRWNDVFALAHSNVAKPLAGWTPSATIKGGKEITLFLTPPADAAAKKHAANIHEVIFFTEDGLVNPDIEQRLERLKDGSVVMHLKVSEYHEGKVPTNLVGIVQTPQKWAAKGPTSATISVPLKTKY